MENLKQNGCVHPLQLLAAGLLSSNGSKAGGARGLVSCNGSSTKTPLEPARGGGGGGRDLRLCGESGAGEFAESAGVRGECEKALVALHRGNTTQALRIIRDACNQNKGCALAQRVQGHIYMRLASLIEDHLSLPKRLQLFHLSLSSMRTFMPRVSMKQRRIARAMRKSSWSANGHFLWILWWIQQKTAFTMNTSMSCPQPRHEFHMCNKS